MPAFASPLDDQLNKLEKKYNIEIIKEKNIPANIKPVELKNIDELRMVLEDYANYSETGNVEYGSIQNTTISPKGLYPSITLYHNYTLVDKVPFKLVSQIKYSKQYNDSLDCFWMCSIFFHDLVEIRNLSCEFTLDGKSATIAPDKKSIQVNVRGSVHQYVTLNGSTYKILLIRFDTDYSINAGGLT
jgi:hypothetical protein